VEERKRRLTVYDEIALQLTDEFEWLPRYASQIRRAWRECGFQGYIIYGPQGSGKTTLSIKLAAEVLRSYSRALRSIVFTRQELEDRIRASIKRLGLKEPVKKLRKLECKRREQVIIWDDASAHADKYMFYSDREYAQRLGITFDLIRRVAACVIVTTPSPARLLKSIREQEWLFFKLHAPSRVPVVIYEKKQYVKIGRFDVYMLSISPSGRAEEYPLDDTQHTFIIHLPENIRKRYTELQYSYMLKAPVLGLEKAEEQEQEEENSEKDE
jgi:predicted ATPase